MNYRAAYSAALARAVGVPFHFIDDKDERDEGIRRWTRKWRNVWSM